MSIENTKFDVKVSTYNCGKGLCTLITFYNDMETMLDCERVKLELVGERLYFWQGDGVKGSTKLSGAKYSKNNLFLYAMAEKVATMEGVYDLDYDGENNAYYIDKSRRITDTPYNAGKDKFKGRKQLNHNPGDRKAANLTIDFNLTERGQMVVEKAKEKKVEDNKAKTKEVVVKALFALLRIQVEGNKEALTTIDTIENFI